MSEPVIRQRTRVSPTAPPPIKLSESQMRWPNGSEVYAQGGAGKELKQLGWIIRRGDKFLAYARTGPAETDVKYLGDAPEFHQALTWLPAKPWGDSYKAPAPQIRTRTRAN